MLGKMDSEKTSQNILLFRELINERRITICYFFLYQYLYLDSSTAPRGTSSIPLCKILQVEISDPLLGGVWLCRNQFWRL